MITAETLKLMKDESLQRRHRPRKVDVFIDADRLKELALHIKKYKWKVETVRI